MFTELHHFVLPKFGKAYTNSMCVHCTRMGPLRFVSSPKAKKEALHERKFGGVL
jgi:hypothetical protein